MQSTFIAQKKIHLLFTHKEKVVILLEFLAPLYSNIVRGYVNIKKNELKKKIYDLAGLVVNSKVYYYSLHFKLHENVDTN